MEWIAEMPPRVRARVAGVFYLLTFVAGSLALGSGTRALVANLVATACYVGVTLLFYVIFRPVNKNLSLLAAFFGLVGCTAGALSAFHLIPAALNPLIFFGVYCLTIGYLIFRSTFLPKTLGVLMAIGGLGWLTFVSPSLATSLFPYNLAPGMIGEGVLTLWLLAVGLNVQRWTAQAAVVEAAP